MNSEYRGEMRGFLLVTCFIMVVPLVLFPRDFGLKLGWSTFVLLALELGWYMLVLLSMFSRESALRVSLFAVVTLVYRIGLGVGFGVLLLVMFSLPVSSALRLGVHFYVPAFLLQAIMSPFVLKSLFQVFLKKRRVAQRPRVIGFEQHNGEVAPSSSVGISREHSDMERPISMDKEMKAAGRASLESILGYVREYVGVKAALLVDQDGLVVGSDSVPGFDAEKIASFSLHLKETNDQALSAMGEKALERIGIYTSEMWICMHQIGQFTLVVLSDRHTDELLSVRILQSTGMIERFLAEKYRLNMAKAVEA